MKEARNMFDFCAGCHGSNFGIPGGFVLSDG